MIALTDGFAWKWEKEAQQTTEQFSISDFVQWWVGGGGFIASAGRPDTTLRGQNWSQPVSPFYLATLVQGLKVLKIRQNQYSSLDHCNFQKLLIFERQVCEPVNTRSSADSRKHLQVDSGFYLCGVESTHTFYMLACVRWRLPSTSMHQNKN